MKLCQWTPRSPFIYSFIHSIIFIGGPHYTPRTSPDTKGNMKKFPLVNMKKFTQVCKTQLVSPVAPRLAGNQCLPASTESLRDRRGLNTLGLTPAQGKKSPCSLPNRFSLYWNKPGNRELRIWQWRQPGHFSSNCEKKLSFWLWTEIQLSVTFALLPHLQAAVPSPLSQAFMFPKWLLRWVLPIHFQVPTPSHNTPFM